MTSANRNRNYIKKILMNRRRWTVVHKTYKTQWEGGLLEFLTKYRGALEVFGTFWLKGSSQSRWSFCGEFLYLDCLTSGLRRHTRSVLRLEGVVQSRRRCSGHQLPLHGRLRRQRVLLSWNIPSATRTQSKHLVTYLHWLRYFKFKRSLKELNINIHDFKAFTVTSC